jgi:hypothetical protein
MSRAHADHGTDWPVAPASLYARYHRDGDRTQYEAYVFERQRRLTRAAVTAATTLDNDWIDQVIDGITALCEQSSWCWPAHDDVGERGDHVPDITRPYVDLGAGEVLAQLSWIDTLLASELDERAPGLRRRMRAEAETRVFAPFVDKRDWHWIGLDGDVHNWNPWIHGNIICGAIALLTGERRDAVIDLATAGLDLYLASLPPDGAIDEGFGYWWNGACRALEAIHLLSESYGQFALEPFAALRASIDFPAAMNLGGAWFVSVADAVARPDDEYAPWHSLHRSARTWDRPEAARFAASRLDAASPAATEHEGCGRLLLALTDTAWHQAMGEPPPPLSDVWLPSVQLGVARPRRGHELTAVLKGGHNDEHHNHIDVGSCIVALKGVPVIVDPGRPTYTRDTFSPRRYELWTMRDDWHSVPAIAGLGQGIGRSFTAREARMDSDDERTVMSVDIAGAYPDSPVPRWQRDVTVDHHRGVTTIRDTWPAFSAPTPTSWRIVVAGVVLDAETPARIRTREGAVALIEWDSTYDAEWDQRELDDPMLADVWGSTLSRLTIRVPHTTKTAEFTLTIREDS